MHSFNNTEVRVSSFDGSVSLVVCYNPSSIGFDVGSASVRDDNYRLLLLGEDYQGCCEMNFSVMLN